jgi:hypothetical protein
MRIHSAPSLYFFIRILYFFLLLVSTEYNVTVMLSFEGDEWYIYIYSSTFFLLFHLKVVCTKSTNCIVDCNIIFLSLSLFLVQSFLVDCCTVRSLEELMRAAFEKTVCLYDDDDKKKLFFFFFYFLFLFVYSTV